MKSESRAPPGTQSLVPPTCQKNQVNFEVCDEALIRGEETRTLSIPLKQHETMRCDTPTRGNAHLTAESLLHQQTQVKKKRNPHHASEHQNSIATSLVWSVCDSLLLFAGTQRPSCVRDKKPTPALHHPTKKGPYMKDSPRHVPLRAQLADYVELCAPPCQWMCIARTPPRSIDQEH